MSQAQLQEAVNQAIVMIEKGSYRDGERILGKVLQYDPNNQLALLWMPACISDETLRRKCYKRLSSIHPAENATDYARACVI